MFDNFKEKLYEGDYNNNERYTIKNLQIRENFEVYEESESNDEDSIEENSQDEDSYEEESSEISNNENSSSENCISSQHI